MTMNKVTKQGDERLMGDPLAPQWLDEYIGQPAIKNLLQREIEAARLNGGVLRKHAVAYGPPGVGKTILGDIIANELGWPRIPSSGGAFDTAKEMYTTLRYIATIAEPFVWVIDEADNMKESAAQILYPVMTHGVYYEDRQQIPLSPVMLYFTSNHPAGVPRAIRSRCRLQLKFTYYEFEDLMQIAIASARRIGLEADLQAAALIAEYALGEPRQVNNLVENSLTFLKTRWSGTTIVRPVVEQVIRDLELYPGGMTKLQVEILEYLDGQTKGRAGLKTIASYVWEDPKDIQDEHERFLIRHAYINMTGAGREITDKGRAYLQAHVYKAEPEVETRPTQGELFA